LVSNADRHRAFMVREVSSLTDAVQWPDCPKCRTQMKLIRVHPDKPGHEMRTFKCQTCGEEKSELIRYK
jgi:hypothetical protein